MQRDERIEQCLDEYHNVLTKTAAWVQSVQENTDELISQKIFTGNVYNYTREAAILHKDEVLVEKYYFEYAYDLIPKLDFLEHFQSDDRSSEVVANINSFVEKIESRLTDPLVARIRRVRKDLEAYYVTALRKASVLEKYLGEFGASWVCSFFVLKCTAERNVVRRAKFLASLTRMERLKQFCTVSSFCMGANFHSSPHV